MITRQSVPPLSKRESGVALILALLVVALAAIAATAMISRQNIDVRRTANIIHSDQAYLYANAAEVFAKQVLIHDEVKETDDRGEVWFQPLPPTPVEGGSIGGALKDLNANFPLNMLVKDDGSINNDYRTVLIRLLQELGVQNYEDVANNICEWIDRDDESQNGMEDIDYMNLDKPYRTGNTQMVSLSELRLIGGVDPKGDTMARILGKELPKDEFATTPAEQRPVRNEPYFNVIPKGSGKNGEIAINVNTAPYELIMALYSEIKPEAAQKVISERQGDDQGSKPFKKVEDFVSMLASESNIVDDKKKKDQNPMVKFKNAMKKLKLDVKSQYFEMTANAVMGDSQLTLKSMLRRTGGNQGEDKVTTLRRGLGEY